MFAFGAIMGFVVGAIIVYQILFADVSEHLNEYATRAIGYGSSFVAGIVLRQLRSSGSSFIPGLLASWALYTRAAAATFLPIYLTPIACSRCSP